MTEPMSERRFNELHAMAWNPEFQPPPEMPDLRRRNDGFRDAVREIGRFRGRVAYGPDAVHALIQILADHRVLALAGEAGVTSELLTALTQWASVTVARESHAAVERAERAEAEVARYRSFCGEAFCGDVERDRDALAAEVERLRALITDEHSRLSQDLERESELPARIAELGKPTVEWGVEHGSLGVLHASGNVEVAREQAVRAGREIRRRIVGEWMLEDGTRPPPVCPRCHGSRKVPNWQNWNTEYGEPRPKPCPDCRGEEAQPDA